MVKKQNNITLNMDLGEMTGGVIPAPSDKLDTIPQFGDYTLKLPPFFAVRNKNGWRLANPLTEMRNLANRQKELSINIIRTNVAEPELDMEPPEISPAFDEFSAKDQAKLVAYFEAVKQGKEKEYLFKNKPRGFPAVLYKNAKKAGLKETKEKVYTKNVIKKQPKIPKAKKGPKGQPTVAEVEEAFPDLEEDTISVEEKKPDYEKEAKNIMNELNKNPSREGRDRIRERMDKLRGNVSTKVFNELKDKINELKRAAKTKGGRLPINLNPLDIIPQGLKAVKDKVVDIAQKVVKGRDGYSPSVTAIIEKFADQEVKSIELHRRVLPTVYTGLLNVLTLGEFNKRIKDQPKDKLFHISMWIKLANGKTVLVEKNEVINMKVNPKKEKEEEVQPAGAVPAGLKFGEMLDKTQKQMGSKYFTYSARDNNCGNYIEAVLKANGMNTKETNDFIGQDAKAILKGYPRIAKVLNAITDIAGRANVVMEGGGMYECEMDSDSECDDKEMNGSGLMGRSFHVATMSNRFHRIPQSESQIQSYLQGKK